MKITDVRIRLIKKDDTKLKAIATITLDDSIVVHDIKVLEGDAGYFIAMPSRKVPTGEFKDVVHPINAETREMLSSAIVDEYHKAVEEASKV